jgi:HAD superfamily hydrolase (TIGR01509 family)
MPEVFVQLPNKVEAVLLDAGGVLLDLDYAYLRRLIEAKHETIDDGALARAESEARREINRTVLAGGSIGESWRDYFRILLGHVGVPSSLTEPIIDSLWSAHRRIGLWTMPVPGAPEVVSRLKGMGLRLGVVSNAEGQVARDLDNAGFSGMFEIVVDSHLVGVEKPDPAIFEIALTKMELDRATTLFVGDMPSVDIAGARAAGLAPVLLDRHDVYGDVSALRLTSLEDLIGLLDSGRQPADPPQRRPT